MHRIAASPRPVDRVAARVLFAKNWYVPDKKIQNKDQDTPFITQCTPRNSKDRTGDKRGDLTVIGFYELNKKKRHLWSCRCICGRYTIRTGDALSRNNIDDQCEICSHNKFIKRHMYYLENK